MKRAIPFVVMVCFCYGPVVSGYQQTRKIQSSPRQKTIKTQNPEQTNKPPNTQATRARSAFDQRLSQELWLAAARGDLSTLSTLLNKSDGHRADVNARNTIGITALMMAAANGHFDVVQALLTNGADANSKDSYGRTALMAAAYNNHRNILELLLASGADVKAVNNDGMSVLMLSAFKSDADAVNAVIAKGSVPQTRNSKGVTVLVWAILSGNPKIVETILAQGVNVNEQVYKTPPLEFTMVIDEKEKLLQIAQLLKDKGAVGRSVPGEGQLGVLIAVASSSVFRAIEENFVLADRAGLSDETTEQKVLDGKVDLNVKDKDGDTLFLQAVKKGQIATVKALLSKGADPNAKSSKGYSALRYAIDGLHDAIVNVLIDAGADVNASAEDGVTPLMTAAYTGNTELVNKLLGKGADVNAKRSDGFTALKFAEIQGHEKIIELLKQAQSKLVK